MASVEIYFRDFEELVDSGKLWLMNRKDVRAMLRGFEQEYRKERANAHKA